MSVIEYHPGFIGMPANDKDAARYAEWMYKVTGYRPVMAGYSLHGGQRIPLFMVGPGLPIPSHARAIKNKKYTRLPPGEGLA